MIWTANRQIKESYPLNKKNGLRNAIWCSILGRSAVHLEEKPEEAPPKDFLVKKKSKQKDRKKNKKGKPPKSKPHEEVKPIDPLDNFGYGIVAYRDIMRWMILGFILLSLLNIPAIYLY